MSIELKIKTIHLSAEAKIIRQEELKLKAKIKWLAERQMPQDRHSEKTLHSLTQHRRWDVRNEQRASFLARAYLAGKPYKSVEAKCNNVNMRQLYILPRVVKMVNKYRNPKADTINIGDLNMWING